MNVGVQALADSAPPFIAKEEGFFKKRGLDVEPKIMQNAAITIAAMQAGSLQVGIVGVSNLLEANESGLDLVVIAGGPTASKTDTLFGIVVKSGSAIARPADLTGKKIGIGGLGGFAHVMAREWLTVHGVNYKTVTFIETPGSLLADLLKAGSVDAVMTFEPFLTRTVSAGIGDKTFFIAADLPDGLPGLVYAAKRDWVAQNPQAVKAFRDALAEAYAFTLARPQDAVAYFGKYVKLPLAALATVKFNPNMSVNMTAAKLALWEDMMRRQGMLRQPINTANVLAQGLGEAR